MEHTKAYQEFKKNGNTKFVRYSEGAEMYHMSVSKFMQMAKDKVFDPKYNKYNFRIHDYFLAKALDQVRPGGMVAVITTKGTLDKANPTIRKYLAERAELVGAVRLPNTAFKDNAGTEVTADILFLQKRERKIDIEPDWVHLGVTENGIAVNSYFAEHPEMMLGSMEYDTRIYGQDSRYAARQGIESGAAGLSCRCNYDMDSTRNGEAGT